MSQQYHPQLFHKFAEFMFCASARSIILNIFENNCEFVMNLSYFCSPQHDYIYCVIRVKGDDAER